MELKNKHLYPKVCLQILDTLKARLPGHLTYHKLDHTIDVANICEHYIDYYMVSDRVAPLIRIAAVGHDYGYIQGPKAHEERSIEALRPLLQSDYGQEEIELISGMIRATKVPQKPNNLYEEIVADADLDYLGRGNYDEMSEGLYHEFIHFGVVDNEADWLEVQIRFLEQHQYHTDWALQQRAETKQAVLQRLKSHRNLNGKKVV